MAAVARRPIVQQTSRSLLERTALMEKAKITLVNKPYRLHWEESRIGLRFEHVQVFECKALENEFRLKSFCSSLSEQFPPTHSKEKTGKAIQP